MKDKKNWWILVGSMWVYTKPRRLRRKEDLTPNK